MSLIDYSGTISLGKMLGSPIARLSQICFSLEGIERGCV